MNDGSLPSLLAGEGRLPRAEPAALFEGPPPFVDLLPVAALACDGLGCVRWFNRRALELFGRAPLAKHAALAGAVRMWGPDGQPLQSGETPVTRALTTGRASRGEEITVERPDGGMVVTTFDVDPVLDRNGSVLGAIGCVHEITASKSPRRLKDLSRRYQEPLQALPAAVYTTDRTGRITFYNEASVALWGCRPELGRSRWCGSWRLYRPDGRPMNHDECPMAVALGEDRPIHGAEALLERPDGMLVPFLAYPTPLYDQAGMLVGAINLLVDITGLKATEDRQNALLDELNHRVKNTLATVQSLAAQTFRETSVPVQVRQAFDGRLLALSKAHDQLARRGWRSADMRSILYDILAPYLDGTRRRIRLAGPAIPLAPRQAIILAMVFHELATNAATHGALSTARGRLALTWSIHAEQGGWHLQIEWQEAGGPRVRSPQQRGFGSRLMERSLAVELKGRTEVLYDPSGFRCSISIPLNASPHESR